MDTRRHQRNQPSCMHAPYLVGGWSEVFSRASEEIKRDYDGGNTEGIQKLLDADVIYPISDNQ
ncbi:unnamed protein product [Rhodiola kirilowii]